MLRVSSEDFKGELLRSRLACAHKKTQHVDAADCQNQGRWQFLRVDEAQPQLPVGARSYYFEVVSVSTKLVWKKQGETETVWLKEDKARTPLVQADPSKYQNFQNTCENFDHRDGLFKKKMTA